MSVHIAGMWDLGWNTPIMEIDLWRYPLQDFGVESLYMTPISGIKNKHVQERTSIEEILTEHKGWKIIFCDERATTPLSDFTHPKKALYIFGKANYSPLLNLKKKNHLSVSIETTGNKGLLWPHQAASIILYDRLMKSKVK